MALLDVIAYVQGIAGAMSGVTSAPSQPTETPGALPTAVTFVVDISYADIGELGPAVLKRLVTFKTLIFKVRVSMPQDISTMTPYGDLFPLALYKDVTLGGTVRTLTSPALAGKFGPVNWSGTETYIGWEFTYAVRMDDTL